jgi:hypothetical protein
MAGYGPHKLKLLHSMKYVYGKCRNAKKINLLQKKLAAKSNVLKITKLI